MKVIIWKGDYPTYAFNAVSIVFPVNTKNNIKGFLLELEDSIKSSDTGEEINLTVSSMTKKQIKKLKPLK